MKETDINEKIPAYRLNFPNMLFFRRIATLQKQFKLNSYFTEQRF